jgi:enolase-phosphatase E1
MIKAIVTDIEGTTSALSFVKDVLFPYARKHMADFVRSHADEPEVKAQLDEVCRLAGETLDQAHISHHPSTASADASDLTGRSPSSRLDVVSTTPAPSSGPSTPSNQRLNALATNSGEKCGLEELIAQLIQWVDEDQKITPLKSLQGMIWESGYRSGAFTGHVYEDAAAALNRWHEQGIRLYVFSSGSVKAQQLIFGYSDFGDLTPLFSGYFDTHIGAKREVEAYHHIVEAVGCAADEILFLSDIVEELQAARSAGMQVLQLVREAQAPWSECRQVTDFSEIDPAAL